MNNMFPYGFNYPQSFPQFQQGEKQPITQNFQLANPSNNNGIFMARFIKEGEAIDNIYITNKTAFINLKSKELIIKDLDGSVNKYGLILPQDEKDLKIEEQSIQINQLQNQINELKEMMGNGQSNAIIPTDNESTQQNGNAKKFRK